jgi:N-acetyl-beta-hexosaminidase
MTLIPKPYDILEGQEGFFTLPATGIRVDIGTFDPSCLCAFLERARLVRLENSDSIEGIQLVQDCNFASDEYKLSISDDGALIKAATNEAVIYALTTLYQLMNTQRQIPYVWIHDMPRYQHRGLSLDVARHFFDAQEVKRIIEQMALVKMNVLHWHLVDDQGWRIESKCFPRLHSQKANSYYTQDEIREVVAFAADRGIEVIPEIDMPGHASSILAAYPEYSCSEKAVSLATCGGIYPIILCAGQEKTYAMISDLLDEICPLFPSKRFHVGGDEAPKSEWQKCPHCQEKIRAEHLANEIELQGYFTNRVKEMLKVKGKTIICWNDSLEASNLNQDALVQFWSVNFAEYLQPYLDKGGQFIYSDMFTFYLDYPHSMTSLKRLYEDPIIIGETDYSESPALRGIEVCIWAEHLDTNEKLEARLFPRLYAAAEVMWSTQCDYCDFEKRLPTFLAAFHPADMVCISQSDWNPKGDSRREEAFKYMASITAAMTPEVLAETAKAAAPNEMFSRRFAQTFFEPSDLPYLAERNRSDN